MKNKTYLILAFLALFSLSSHSYFHISEFDLEHSHELDHEHEKESCDQCNLAETSFFVDEDFNNANLFLENYFFSHQANLTNLFNYHLLIRAPPVT